MLRLYVVLVLLAGLAAWSRGGPADSMQSRVPSRYLYVWAGTGKGSVPGIDMMTVLDADPTRPGYGRVISALTVDTAGLRPHHSELRAPLSRSLFVNDFEGNKSFLVDFSVPETPRLVGRVATVPSGRKVHSFLRLPNGNVLATVQFGDSTIPGDPGGLAEFDGQGRLLRYRTSRDSTFPGARIRTYSLTLVPQLDRVVTTSSPMDDESTADVVQVWRASDLALLKTLAVPQADDSAHRYPFELVTLVDGTVLVNTYNCGFFRISDLAAAPKIVRVLALPLPQNVGCSVPVLSGRFLVMPVAYAHRFATIDVSDPARPREVASLSTDTTFYPHWASPDPGSDRFVFTGQGDGQPVVIIAHFDRTTGRLAWDSTFKDPGATSPGVSYHKAVWPNGVHGMAMPHGAVFVP